MSLFPQVGRSQPRLKFAWWALVTFLGLGVLLHLLPFYFMLITSLKPSLEVLKSPPTLWPHDVTWSAWKLILNAASGARNLDGGQLLDHPFWIDFKNSIVIAFVTLALSLPITALAAYANSKLQRGPLARWSFLFFIGTLFVPLAVTLIPSFLLTRNFPFATPDVPTLGGARLPHLELWNTPWAVIIPGLFSAFNFLLFKGFFDTIPDSVIQAARVDGGTELNIFRRIVLPISIPVFAVAAWTQFSAVWDTYLWPSLVLQDPEKATTAVTVYNLSQKLTALGATNAAGSVGQTEAMKQVLDAGLSYNGLMVLGIVQTLPIFLMFLLCREYLLKGVRIRGLK